MTRQRLDHDFQSCSRTYATLCIYHDDVLPEEITSSLGVMPDRTVRKGQTISLGSAPRNGWFYGTLEKIDSKDLGVHVHWLANKLRDKRQQLFELARRGCELRIMCFWASASGNGGPVFGHPLLVELSEIPVDVHLDVWFQEIKGPSSI